MFRPNRLAKSRAPRAEKTRKLVFGALEKRELLAVSYLNAATAELDDAQTALASEINAEKTLNTSVWNASETAHDGTLNAIVAADNSSDVATYVNASLGSALSYASSVASAFGTFQIGTRQARYNATATTNPRKAFYGQEVTRATNMKSLRDQYYSSLNPAFDNPEFFRTVADNSVQTGIALSTLGASEIYFGLRDYLQTGDADALAERMGGMAAGNLLTATGLRLTSYNYRIRGLRTGFKLEKKARYDDVRPLIRDEKFLNEVGHVIWPPNNGAVNGYEIDFTLDKGTRVNRYNVPG